MQNWIQSRNEYASVFCKIKTKKLKCETNDGIKTKKNSKNKITSEQNIIKINASTRIIFQLEWIFLHLPMCQFLQLIEFQFFAVFYIIYLIH